MTDQPYTDADLRTEGAICLAALSTSPTVADILRWLPGAYIESRRNADRSGPTWEDVVDSEGLAGIARQVHGLIDSVPDLSRWSVDLGASGLSETTSLAWGHGDNWDLAVQIAHRPGLDAGLHNELVDAARTAIQSVLDRRGIDSPHTT